MRERFKQWPPKIKAHRGWVIGAIATPACLGMVWWLGLLPERRLQADDGHRPPTESTALVHPHRQTLINGMRAIAVVAGGAFLAFNFPTAHRKVEAVSLSGADLVGHNFCGADLSGTDLSGANLCDANLSGADLNGANLCDANLSGANLSGANLHGANLNGAEFKYANLSDADIRYANLSAADLRYANLSAADLNCALLSDANLSDAKLSGALLFFINSRGALNLEPLQLEAQPRPFCAMWPCLPTPANPMSIPIATALAFPNC